MNFLGKFGLLVICFIELIVLAESGSPSLNPSDERVFKYIGESYSVSCSAPWGSSINDHKWLDPTHREVDKSDINRVRWSFYWGKKDLVISRITNDDSGVYQCRNKGGDSASFRLIVLRHIILDDSNSEQSAQEGNTFRMQCGVKSHEIRQIIFDWKVDNETVEVGAGEKYSTSQNQNYMVIRNVTDEDAKKNYECIAKDSDAPEVNSKMLNIKLKVNSKPRFLEGTKTDHFTKLNEWVNLTCSVRAEPPARFEWSYKNRTLVASEEILILNPQDNVSILRVMAKDESKLGGYACRARNEIGTLVTSMTLSRGINPGVPSLEAIHVAYDGAQIKVNQVEGFDDSSNVTPSGLNQEFPIIGYIVQCRNMTPDESEWTMYNVTEYATGFVIQNLNPGTVYKIRVALRNKAFVGEFSEPLNFTTLSRFSNMEAEAESISDLSGLNSHLASVSLTITPPGPCEIKEYLQEIKVANISPEVLEQLTDILAAKVAAKLEPKFIEIEMLIKNLTELVARN